MMGYGNTALFDLEFGDLTGPEVMADLAEEVCELQTSPSISCPATPAAKDSLALSDSDDPNNLINQMWEIKRSYEQTQSPGFLSNFMTSNFLQDDPCDFLVPFAEPELSNDNQNQTSIAPCEIIPTSFMQSLVQPHALEQQELVVAPMLTQFDNKIQITQSLSGYIIPFEFQQEVGNVTGGAKKIVHRRKSDQAPRSKELPYFEETITNENDVKPIMNNSNVTSTRVRKRGAAPTTTTNPSSPIAYKKIKKYELDEDESPSVRNAKAAKANRDKKKKELEDLKAALQAKETENLKLHEDNVMLTKRNKELTQQNAKALSHLRSITGLGQIQKEMNSYLGTVLPAIVSNFGSIPNIVLAPGFDTPITPGGRYISTHFNLDNKTLIIGNPHTK